MTAAYEIPVHLLPAVKVGVILAADVVTTADGNHYGRPLLEVADEWYAKVLFSNRHEDLLKPAEAESLLAVLEVAFRYVLSMNYAETGITDQTQDEEMDDVMFALQSDEIRFALQEIVMSDRLAFA